MKKEITACIVIVGLLATSVAFVGCDKSSTTEAENLLLGLWNSSTAGLGLFLTTNSAQQAVNMLAQATGALNITGLYDVALRWIIGFGDPTMTAFMVTNQSMLQFLLLPSFPTYNLMLVNIPFVANLTGFSALPTAASDTLTYLGNFADFAYDRPTHTLTANNAQFIDDTGTPVVFANGAITQPTIDVPANTPTNVLPLNLPLPGVGQLVFAEDGTFTLTIGFGEDEEELTGTWEDLGDNQLQVTVVIEEGEDPETAVLDYTVDAQTLTVTYEEDLCTLLTSALEGDCAQLVEMVFGMAPGSFTSGIVRLTLTFTKAAQKGAVSPYLHGWNPTQESLSAFIYGRLFGNAAKMLGM